MVVKGACKGILETTFQVTLQSTFKGTLEMTFQGTFEGAFKGLAKGTKNIGKWSFSLEAYDFLNTEFYTSRAEYNDLNIYSTYKGESRSFWLDIVYRFGNKKIKESRERKIGEDENERVE